jgi:hypothetical protein
MPACYHAGRCNLVCVILLNKNTESEKTESEPALKKYPGLRGIFLEYMFS